jgi:hypothetical protein
MFSTAAVLPLVARLGDYLRSAGEQAKRAVASGAVVAPDVIASVLEREMAGWHPAINGREVFDAETRRAAARFLAGVAVNVVVGKKEKAA